MNKVFATFALISILILSLGLKAQKVGIVLSGGGASGLAHIGFLRALEENNIPIDYISGTSMGALIGGLYSAGYTTQEIELIFTSEDFRLWTEGKIDDKYVHYFKKFPDDASWIKLKLSLDSLIENNIPTNIINSTSLDFGLAGLFSSTTAASKGKFDDMFVPFRCLASDITSKSSFVFREGDLATAVRASISYPFFLNPVNLDGKLLYDGGLYDNFPVSTLCKEFEPEYIIGSNVSYNFPPPDEGNILSQIRSMMSYDTKYEIECEKGFIVEPKVPPLSLMDYSSVHEIVQIGYNEAIKKIDSIKRYAPQSRSQEEVQMRRSAFNESKPKLQVKDIVVHGLNESESKYIKSSIRFHKDSLNFNDLEKQILKLASDDKIQRISPELIYIDSLNGFVLALHVKKEKKFFVSFGGNISTMSVNEGFVALQYNHLSHTPISIYGNTYFGKFYSSGLGLLRLDVPWKVPFQLHSSFTFNKWDYFQNSTVLVEESTPSYLVQRENYFQAGLTFPVSYKGKLGLYANVGEVKYEYYQDNNFTRFDTTDLTTFDNVSFNAAYERNSLNKKQYANKGSHLLIRGSLIEGQETTTPGSEYSKDSIFESDRSWYRIKIHYDKYFELNRHFNVGLLLEGMYSDQPFFSNYSSTLLSSPGFEPIPESKTIFRSKYRAHQYAAAGIKGIYTPFKNFDIRLEGYSFKPIKETVVKSDGSLTYEESIENFYFIGSFTLVYDFNFTQIAVNVNYYDNFNDEFPTSNPENYTFMLHLGFVLFNQKMMD